MICLTINYNLVKKKIPKIHIFYLFNFGFFLYMYFYIKLALFFEMRLIQSKNGHDHRPVLNAYTGIWIHVITIWHYISGCFCNNSVFFNRQWYNEQQTIIVTVNILIERAVSKTYPILSSFWILENIFSQST